MKSAVAGVESRWCRFYSPMRNFAADVFKDTRYRRWWSPVLGTWFGGETKSGSWSPGLLARPTRATGRKARATGGVRGVAGPLRWIRGRTWAFSA